MSAPRAEWVHDKLTAIDWRAQPFNYITYKYDGFRCTLFKQPSGRLCAFLRSKDVTHQIEHLSWYKRAKAELPAYSSIDGELLVYGKPSTAVATALANGTEELAYEVFAIPYWKENDIRTWSLEVVSNMVQDLGLQFGEYRPITGNWPATTEKFKKLLNDTNYARQRPEPPKFGRNAHQIEGFVLKVANYLGWYKYKPIRTVDAVVTGLYPGVGRLRGMVGSLLVSVYRDGALVEIAAVSGMDDETRREAASSVGRVVEVEYMEIASQGRLRHPRFLRWRDDKPANECVL